MILEQDFLGETEDGKMLTNMVAFIVWELAVDSASDKERRTDLSKKDNTGALADALAGIGFKMKGTASAMET